MHIRDIKQATKKSLLDSSRNPMALTFLFVLCLNAPYFIYNLLDTLLFFGMDTSPTGIGGFNTYAAYLSFSTILTVAIGVFAGIWQCCYQNYTLNVSRGKEVSFRDFTAPLRIAGKVFWLNFLIAVYTALWALVFLLPITFAVSLFAPELALSMMQDPESYSLVTAVFMIPGYLMAYRYRLSFLILFDHEEWRASEAISASKRLTYGYKMKFFQMDLSFFWYYIPYAAITVLLPNVLLSLFQETTAGTYLIAISVPLILEIIFCALFQPQVKTADAHAYNCILQNAPTVPPKNDGFPVFPGQQADSPHDHNGYLTGLQDDQKDDSWHSYE